MAKRSNARGKAWRVGYKEESRGDHEGRIGDLIKPQPDGCWHFTGTLNDAGYGTVWTGYADVLAHRYVYDMLTDGIPDGMSLHHECQVKHCVNPAHLTPMTRSEHSKHHHDLRAATEAA